MTMSCQTSTASSLHGFLCSVSREAYGVHHILCLSLLQIFTGIGPGLKLVVSEIRGSHLGPGKANSN